MRAPNPPSPSHALEFPSPSPTIAWLAECMALIPEEPSPEPPTMQHGWQGLVHALCLLHSLPALPAALPPALLPTWALGQGAPSQPLTASPRPCINRCSVDSSPWSGSRLPLAQPTWTHVTTLGQGAHRGSWACHHQQVSEQNTRHSLHSAFLRAACTDHSEPLAVMPFLCL
jgi:hypothetical protein